MRVVAAILCIVLAICSLGIQGNVQAYPSVSFNVSGATLITYRDFMCQLRKILSCSWRTCAVNDLPVLNLENEVSNGTRFVLADLSNNTDRTVTFAIDVVNLYVVAFAGGDNKSYFFEDATPFQLDNLFVSTNQTLLPFNNSFNNSYGSLQEVSGLNRTEISLGPSYLADAIIELWDTAIAPDLYIAQSLIVVFQMVSEAARFKYIEEQVRESIAFASSFKPKGLIVSMEDEWGSMSQQVLLSPNGEDFINPVQLLDDNFQSLIINNFTALSHYTMIAILLGNQTTTSSYSNIALAEYFVNNELLKL